MGDVKRFLEESPLSQRISLPTCIILHRLSLSPADIERIVEQRKLVPETPGTWELEIGGQCVARGRIIRRRGQRWFKVTEMAALSPALPEATAEGGESR